MAKQFKPSTSLLIASRLERFFCNVFDKATKDGWETLEDVFDNLPTVKRQKPSPKRNRDEYEEITAPST